MTPRYVCPNCLSPHDLVVVVTATARLEQQEDGGIETDIIGDHDWNDDSKMACFCGHSGTADDFVVERLPGSHEEESE